jgi:hypothetical protein
VALFAKIKPAYTVFRELRHSNQTMGGLKRYSEARSRKLCLRPPAEDGYRSPHFAIILISDDPLLPRLGFPAAVSNKAGSGFLIDTGIGPSPPSR